MAEYSKERAIAAQNAATAAATLLQGQQVSVEQFEQVRRAIFEGTLSLSGQQDAPVSAEQAAVATVTEAFPGAQAQPAQQAPNIPVPPSNSGGGSDAGGVVIKFGKMKGKTIAQAHAEEPDYVQWLGESSNNDFIKGKVQEFLGSVAA